LALSWVLKIGRNPQGRRYEASLERNFDRALSQLERVQRVRLGQPEGTEVKLEAERHEWDLFRAE
jgi:hypothetical protein